MASKITSKEKLDIRHSTLDIVKDPIVLEPQKMDFKAAFSILSSFVAIGGDFT